MNRLAWIAAPMAALSALFTLGCGVKAAEPVVHFDERKQEQPASEAPDAPTDAGDDAKSAKTPQPQEAQGYAQKLLEVFAEAGALADMAPFSDSELLDYYGIDTAACRSAAGYVDVNGLADEIVVVEADEQTASEIEALLGDHLAAKKAQYDGYDANAFSLVKGAVLRRDGGVVLMIVSPAAESLLELYRMAAF